MTRQARKLSGLGTYQGVWYRHASTVAAGGPLFWSNTIVVAYEKNDQKNRPHDQGALAQELSYDAWGRRRNPTTWEYYDAISDANAWQERGFGGHEHLDLFEMVNMDGRMYDPVIGRFLSADPFVQAPDYTQGLNRYIYCLNNPLSLTDPSGYNWFSDNWKSIVASVVGIAASVVTAGAGATLGVAILAGAIGGAASALTGALLNGANIGQIAKATFVGAFWGGISAFLSYASSDPQLLAKLFKHTFSQAWLEGVQGGNMFHGMMMGAVSSTGGHYIDKYAKSIGKVGEISANAILSGTVDEIGGGKFANGAITGTFHIMFNDMMHGANDNEDENLPSILNGQYPLEKPLESVYPEFFVFLFGKSIANGAIEATLSLLSKNQRFSSIEDLIHNMGNIKKLKHGEIHGTIRANKMDKIFYSLARKYKAQVNYAPNGSPYFSANGYRVQMYNSSSGAGSSIQINSGRQIYKIRLMKNLKK